MKSTPSSRGLYGRAGRVDLEAVALGTLGVGALHERVVHAGPGDRALGVVDDDPRGHGAEPLEGAAVTAEPGRHRLIPDELDVLVARPGTASSRSTRCGVSRPSPDRSARGRRRSRPARPRPARSPAARWPRGCARRRSLRACAAPPSSCPGSRARATAPRGSPPRRRRRRPSARPARGAARRVEMVDRARPAAPTSAAIVASSGSGARGASQPCVGGQCPQARGLGPAHQPGAGNVAVGVALAHAHQDLSVLKHLESPAAHRSPSRAKSREGNGAASIRDARPPLTWLLYADQPLAPLRRSRRGSIMPIRTWLQYADHGVAPICRSVTASQPA